MNIVESRIGKHKLKVVRGSIREEPDQDDAWFFKLADMYDNIIDVGANIGVTALMAKVQHPDRKLLLIDPNPEAITIAARNLFVNKWERNVQFKVSLISNTRGEKLKFYTFRHGAAGSVFQGHATTAAKFNSFIEVESVLLDDVLEDIAWSPKFIKVDVEGAESMVLEGAKKIVAAHKPAFMVEMHNPPELPMVKNTQLVLDWCKEVGYKAWYMRDAAELKTAETLADRGKCHLFLIPKEQEYPAELARIQQRDPVQ